MALMAETSPFHPGFRRSATLPSRLQGNPTRYQEESARVDVEGVETLFLHPSAKVISFNVPGVASRPSSSSGAWLNSPGVAAPLPWASRSERVISVGLLEIYRLRGLVSFLKAGALLLTLLPKSQCWCVDGVYKFAMRIERLIYRIELPHVTEDDIARIEDFKKVLKTVLLFETTPCPFGREFTVDIPIESSSPLPRKPRKVYQMTSTWAIDDIRQNEALNGNFAASSAQNVSDFIDEDSSFSDGRTAKSRNNRTSIDSQQEITTIPAMQPMKSSDSRSVTAPPQFAFNASTSPTHSGSSTSLHSLDGTSDPTEYQSISSSLESFHTSFEYMSPCLPSPSSVDPDSPKTPQTPEGTGTNNAIIHSHARCDSETTITPNTPETPKAARNRPEHSPRSSNSTANYPDLDSHWIDLGTPSPLTRQRHSPSLNPIAERPVTPVNRTIFSNSRSSSPSDDLTSALVSKTCAILLSPPSNLVAIMMQIASRIASGAIAGMPAAYRFRARSGYSLPGRWEDSDDDVGEDDWGEDDYGVPLGNDTPERTRRKQWGGSGWDVD